MQNYAYDQEGNLIPANQALRHRNYRCLECQKIVRLRGGYWRQLHFYHLDPPKTCRLSGKSLAHLNTQYALQKILAHEETFLEYRFPQIRRIADVVWPAKKRVFEVQCSPISVAEVEARQRDYAQIGYSVVWIFHDRKYNRFRLTPVESYLRHSYYFFTNIGASGRGIIYDQPSKIHRGRRIERSSSIPIQFQHLSMQTARQSSLPVIKKPFYLPNFYRAFYHLILERLTKSH